LNVRFFAIGIPIVVLAIIFPFITNFNYVYWLEISIIVGSIGALLIIHGFLSSEQTNQKIDYKIAWNSNLFKAITLLSLTLAVTFSFHFYTVSNSLNLASVDFKYQNEINNLNIQHQNEIESLRMNYQNEIEILNQQIINAQHDDTALRNEITRLQVLIEEYKRQESDLQRELRLKLVTVYGEFPARDWWSSYDSIVFTNNGTSHTVKIKDNSYSISLENWKNYNVTINIESWIPWGNDKIERTYQLYSEEEINTKDWLFD